MENERIVSYSGRADYLITEEDKTGRDIAKMSNFFDEYINQLSLEFTNVSYSKVISDVPIEDIGLVSEVIREAKAKSNNRINLVPDFESLPSDIRKKLKEGIYKIGESRQVEDNLRAVIVDENGNRVKDITLKEIKEDTNTRETANNLTNQLQMRDLAQKLEDIQELQSYQIERDRSRDIITPLLTARDYLRFAQISQTEEERIDNLQKASDKMLVAINSIYDDMNTSTKHLYKATRRPILQRKDIVELYIGNITSDLQIANKFVGLQMRVLSDLGRPEAAKVVADQYSSVLHGFFVNQIDADGTTAALLLHNYYPYNKENKNGWYKLSKEMVPVLETGSFLNEKKKVYLVSAEEINHE